MACAPMDAYDRTYLPEPGFVLRPKHPQSYRHPQFGLRYRVSRLLLKAFSLFINGLVTYVSVV